MLDTVRYVSTRDEGGIAKEVSPSDSDMLCVAPASLGGAHVRLILGTGADVVGLTRKGVVELIAALVDSLE